MDNLEGKIENLAFIDIRKKFIESIIKIEDTIWKINPYATKNPPNTCFLCNKELDEESFVYNVFFKGDSMYENLHKKCVDKFNTPNSINFISGSEEIT